MYMQSKTREILHESLHVYSYRQWNIFACAMEIDIITESLKTVPTFFKGHYET